MKYRLYTFVLRQLSGIDKGIQAAHAMLEYANDFSDSKEYKSFIENDKTVIILNGGTSADLEEITNKLDKYGISNSVFFEEDLGDCMTAVSFLADERVFDKEKYPDFEEWQSKEAIFNGLPAYFNDVDGNFIGFNHKEMADYLELIGGKGNFYLREIISTHRLASN